MARACAAQTKSTFLKLAGPQLVQLSLEMEPNWFEMHLPWPRRRRQQSSSLMNWTRLAPRDSTRRRPETERSREPCWSCSISWTGSPPPRTSRSLRPRTELTFSIRPCSGLGGWTGRSNFRANRRGQSEDYADSLQKDEYLSRGQLWRVWRGPRTILTGLSVKRFVSRLEWLLWGERPPRSITRTSWTQSWRFRQRKNRIWTITPEHILQQTIKQN